MPVLDCIDGTLSWSAWKVKKSSRFTAVDEFGILECCVGNGVETNGAVVEFSRDI